MSKTSHISAAAPFDHDSKSYSEGVHEVPADIATAIVKDGKAKPFKKPAEQTEKKD